MKAPSIITLCRVSLTLLAGVVFAPGADVAGEVIAWGRNDFEQTNVPMDLTNVVSVAGGYGHAVALKADGTIVPWGRNVPGFNEVPSTLTNATQIASGYFFNVARLATGAVFIWGENYFGGFELGYTNIVAVGTAYHNHIFLVRADGTLVPWDPELDPPPGVSNVLAVAGGDGHAVALRTDGTVVAWGGNDSGQTNVPNALSGVTAVAAGGAHSMALKSNGTVVAWGSNSSGQTNVPADLTNVVAIAAGTSHSLALRTDGTVVAWGLNTYGQTDVPSGLANVTAIAGGGYFSLAITATELRINSIERNDQKSALRFHTFSGRNYTLEFSTNLDPQSWTELPGGSLPGTGFDATLTDTNPITGDDQRFYRLRSNPSTP